MVEQTWLAIAASLLMGAGAIVVFIYAAKRDYFQDLEEAKYQVFWSDLEQLVESGGPGTQEAGQKKEEEGEA